MKPRARLFKVAILSASVCLLVGRSRTVTGGVERVNLNRAQATALASRLLGALEVNQDSTTVPPPYNFGDKILHIVAEGLGLEQAIVAEGLGIQAGRGQN
jgi:hypothetical protein